MQTRTLEIGVGLFLLAGLLALLLLALRVSGLSVGNAGDTYKVYAYFDNIAGVTVRGKVTLAGVTIGKVTAVDLDRDSYTGRVTMEINQNVNNLPVDSTASILTAGLLGEKYIGISVGGDEDVLKDGSTIHDTQSALVLEDLIGKFLLNSVNKDEAKSEVFFHADSSASRPAGVPGGFPLLSMAAPTPQQVVQGTVDELLSDIKANKAAYKADPQKLYATLDRILGPVVDAEGIAKSVMTVKYSRQASPEQIKRFEEVFKNSLMQFYGNALLEYDNQDIRVLPSSAKPSDDRASVNMEIRDSKGTVYPVSYTMTNLAGGWKVRNVIINGINIGKLFRDQFADTMQKNRNDLEKTIAGWGEVVAKAKETAKAEEAGAK